MDDVLNELAKKYTYNGSISIKALEDDINTLQNQLENFNLIKQEVIVRKKNVSPISAKISDTEIQLSLLKSLLKREKKKKKEEETAILEVLNVTDKEIKEDVNKSETIVDNKQPIKQDFLTSNVEETTDEDIILDETLPEKENVEEKDIVGIENTEYDNTLEKQFRSEEKKVITVKMPSPVNSNETIIFGVKIDKNALKENANGRIYPEAILKRGVEEYRAMLEKEKNPKEYGITHKERENVSEEALPIERENEKINEITTPINQEIENISRNHTEDSVEKFKTMLEKEKEQQTDNVSITKEAEVLDKDYLCSNPFYNEKRTISMSIDLSEVTNMVNTKSVEATLNYKAKKVTFWFSDIKDYPIFLHLLGEFNKKKSIFSNFLQKNSKNIFIETEEIDYTTGKGHIISLITLSKCKLIDLCDDTQTFEEREKINWSATFKYKDFKIE